MRPAGRLVNLLLFVIGTGLGSPYSTGRSGERPPAWKPVEDVLGQPGEKVGASTYRVTLLRKDVAVKDERGMLIPP